MTDSLIDRLTEIVGADQVLVDPAVMDAFRRDMTPLAPAGMPRAVVRPGSTAEVAAVVAACAAAGVPIVPRGAGSGLSGAANAVDGAVTLVMTRMNRILQIDAANRVAVVQPGVVNKDLRTAAAPHGLFYAPDPSSYDWCTIGGNIAMNAGGLCCVKYGVTTEAVLGLEVVLASGEVVRTGRRTVKGVAGYDLTHLLVGSEGTLGIVTEATLALRPLPEAPRTMVAAFDRVEDAGAAVAAIVAAGLVPSLLEIMDGPTIEAVEAHTGQSILGDDTTPAAILMGQSDAGGERAERDMAGIVACCEEAGATLTYQTADLDEGQMLMHARREVLPSLEARGTCAVDDVCVPRTAIAALIRGCEEIASDTGLLITVVGHAGDGNMHPTIVFDPADDAQAAAVPVAYDRMLALGRSLGGTITGEHGVGRIKQRHLKDELGPVGVALHRAVKDAFDPAGLLNPGAMLG